ncbi:hypothetical protein CRENPOLYSF2_980016 [Crenothrix polyspora]|uniref:Uncharacterized protein n=1 Tax=Crenothrix polyspora TaxID=360316 RepID=A0A1R4HJC5_9GAMM|nr:hypothetical protein CRENPOLYSF2_980016 [Crenothrix polyspora]
MLNGWTYHLRYTQILRGCLETLNASQIDQGFAYCFNGNLNLTR